MALDGAPASESASAPAGAAEAADALDRAPCGFLSVDDDGRVRLVNATLLDRLGYARADVVGAHVERLLALASRIFYQTHLFPLVRLHGRAQEIFLLLRTRGGQDVGVLCNAVRHERAGATVTDCVFVEVEERRRYEEALLLARREADRAKAEVSARARELDEANAELEAQALELELHQQQMQEQAVELETQAAALIDMNERLRARGDELEHQRAVADEANRAKSEFLAVMSHELRTPLNAIGGYAELVDLGVYGAVTDAQHEALGRITRSQRHLLRLINDILNLARVESGRVEYRDEPVPVAELVASVTPMVEPQFAAKGLTLECAVGDGLVACADREKAQQVLLNLLTNALKFTDTGGRVRVEGRASPGTDGRIHIAVSDTGRGIPPDMCERVFEPFVQVSAGWTRATEGTGLGLAISRDLARGMGGDLTVQSEVGRGSVFVLELREEGRGKREARTEERA